MNLGVVPTLRCVAVIFASWSVPLLIYPGQSFTEGPMVNQGFPGGSVVKNPPANAGDLSLIPGSGRFPWRRKRQPTPIFSPGESHGQEEPGGAMVCEAAKESDRTWRLHSNRQTSQNFPSPSLHAERRGSEHSYTSLYSRPRCPRSELVHLHRPRLHPH